MHGRSHLFLGIILIMFAAVPHGFGEEPNAEEISEIRLLPAEYDAWSCDISPNGERVVFSGKPKGEDSMKMRVWLMNLPEGTPVMWTNTEGLMDSNPRWSPTGDGVVMVRRSKLNSEAKGTGIASSIWWKAYPGGEGLQLTIGPDDREPAWSPDAKFIVFVRGQAEAGGESLVVMDRMGQQQRVLLTDLEGSLADPYWGVDGFIYYTRYQYQRSVISVAGKNYEGLKREKGTIERVRPETGKTEVLLQNDEDNRSPVLSPDGRYLAFISTQGARLVSGRIYDRGALWVMNMKDRRMQLLTDRVGLNGSPPVWMPRGSRIIFFSYRQIRPALWCVSVK